MHIVLLCFFWTIGRINNHSTKKSVYSEKGPPIILKQEKGFQKNQ